MGVQILHDISILFDVIPEEDRKGFYTVVPALLGCFSQGTTVEKALANTKKAIRLHLKMLKRKGDYIPSKGLALHAIVEVPA